MKKLIYLSAVIGLLLVCVSYGVQTPTSAPHKPATPRAPAPKTTPATPTTAPAASSGAPAGMVLVPAGPFLMGSDIYQRDEKPSRTVTLKAFYIDIMEVTYGDYLRCGSCKRPRFGKAAGKDWVHPSANWPAIGISWVDANNYCKSKKKRLPTEAEWEKAARGNTGNPYPWGDTLDCQHANYIKCERNHPIAVGSYPLGKSPYGALDMAGNAQEWVADWYDSEYYKTAPLTDPPGPATGTKRVLRGGSYDYASQALRASYRYSDYPTNDDTSYGFRCAANP